MQEEDTIITIYCAISEKLLYDNKAGNGLLWRSEILLCGVLFALRGGGFSSFYRWLCRRGLLNLPERSRLLKLIKKYAYQTALFLTPSMLFNIIPLFSIA